MLRIFTAELLPDVAVVKAMLEAQQIPCVIRNEYLASGIGDLPLVECWPELWLLHDHHLPRATELLRQYQDTSGHAQEPAWQCAACGESVDAIFACCWNCQADRPSVQDFKA